ncbi:mitochondrial carrier domain-containing protein [Aspergillus cavernicola]|uniref:Mitochondrial carrier domain-containing protein n=1 Tax=Aspergillus cavernicola TaxID=176166 RepID=A0ABR4IC31_9EURO
MSLTSRVFSLFTPTATSTDPPASAVPSVDSNNGIHIGPIRAGTSTGLRNEPSDLDEEEPRPPYLHAMLAGGTGGTCGDMLMHSLDTVKTRQQGDPHFPPRYTSMTSSYATIYRQEGILRGLYGGVTPALLGSFPGTLIFFGVYEFMKRKMLDAGINPNVAYLSGGFFADLAASVVYVPSEVLKTRLQLQGRYNNPHFKSGYNYRSTGDALRTIVRQEGFSALFHGYKATIFRDLPFSALQFAFYEQEQRLAKEWVGSRDIGLGLEVLTAATAGGMAGVITCPMDVLKTRIQTQQNPESAPASTSPKTTTGQKPTSAMRAQSRAISTSASVSSPATPPGALRLDTSSFFSGLRTIYHTEGLAGWFRGVGPRGVWTSIQSGTMLVMYQYLLKQFEAFENMEDANPL